MANTASVSIKTMILRSVSKVRSKLEVRSWLIKVEKMFSSMRPIRENISDSISNSIERVFASSNNGMVLGGCARDGKME